MLNRATIGQKFLQFLQCCCDLGPPGTFLISLCHFFINFERKTSCFFSIGPQFTAIIDYYLHLLLQPIFHLFILKYPIPNVSVFQLN